MWQRLTHEKLGTNKSTVFDPSSTITFSITSPKSYGLLPIYIRGIIITRGIIVQHPVKISKLLKFGWNKNHRLKPHITFLKCLLLVSFQSSQFDCENMDPETDFSYSAEVPDWYQQATNSNYSYNCESDDPFIMDELSFTLLHECELQNQVRFNTFP